MKRLYLLLLASSVMSACESVPNRDMGEHLSIEDIYEDPASYHGAVLTDTIYPIDTGERGGFPFCTAPCPDDENLDILTHSIVYSTQDVADQWSGYDGETPVEVTIKFNAVCFIGDMLCLGSLHYKFDLID